MKVVPVFRAKATSRGVMFTPDQRRALDMYVATLDGKDLDLTVKVHRDTRSLAQNAWHWAVAVPLIAEAMGHDHHEHEQVHYALVSKCFGVTVDEKTGLEIPNARSSQLTTVQFSELMEWEVRFAAQMWPSMVIPLPDDAEPERETSCHSDSLI